MISVDDNVIRGCTERAIVFWKCDAYSNISKKCNNDQLQMQQRMITVVEGACSAASTQALFNITVIIILKER